MAETFREILFAAFNNTRCFFGWNRRSCIVPILFLAGATFQYIIFGFEAVMDEVILRILYVLAPIGGFTIVLFFWNIIKVPVKQIDKRQGTMIVGCIFILTLSLQLLPKIDLEYLFPNKEKEEVRLLIDRAIIELNQMKLHQKSHVAKINKTTDENKKRDILNMNPIDESIRLNELMDNDLFFKYCRETFSRLLSCQGNMRDLSRVINDPNEESDYRVDLLEANIVYITFSEVLLKFTMGLLNGDIDEKEFIETIGEIGRKVFPGSYYD